MRQKNFSGFKNNVIILQKTDLAIISLVRHDRNMTEKRKNILLELLEREISEREKRLNSAQNTVQDYAKITMGSWSANGDRANAEAVARMIKESLHTAIGLKEEILKSETSRPQAVLPPCFVRLAYVQPEKKELEFYLVNTNIELPGVKTLTAGSPLGKSILNKNIGENFSYQIADKTVSGEIEAIE